MRSISILAVLATCLTAASASQWPYKRLHSSVPFSQINKSDPSVTAHEGHFVSWFRGIVNKDQSGSLPDIFKNGTIPDEKKLTFDSLVDFIQLPESAPEGPRTGPPPAGDTKGSKNLSSHEEAQRVFQHLNYSVDARCTTDRAWWWYRTYDGSCNWLKQDEWNEGAVGTRRERDYKQHAYADGVSEPREGPNARAVSNAFFRRKKAIYYEHTPFLLGLVEFIMHDVTYSLDSASEYVEVPMPEDEDTYPLNTTFKVMRTAPMPDTGTSKANPRENVNMATTWLDMSALYGSTPDVANALRSHKGGKLLTQEVQARGTGGKASYLPYNSMNVSTRTRPGVDPAKLFAGGDPRTNEDWMMLGVHTLFLRDHNRICDILTKQRPEYDDEQLFQTVRMVMGAKYMMIANSYQMAYWTEDMPWPNDDGFPLYRLMYDEDALDINPATTYPWPLVTKGGKPMTVSVEMAVIYRFHEFIIPSFPIKNGNNETLWEQDLFATGFNSTGFVDAGLENIVRGMLATHIPNFNIVHEREQGLPTFNQYFRAYNEQDPAIEVPIRDTFEKFSSDPETVANLKKLYKHPDEVDLVVGCQLDEENFPGTTVPKASLIISLFSLFGMGNSDRFSIGYAMMRCFLVDKPWDCHPSNALEDLVWERRHVPGFPDFRVYSTFWLKEMDIEAHGANLLWRLITENSEIKCIQERPLFPMDPETNPVLCDLPDEPFDFPGVAVTAMAAAKFLLRRDKLEIIVSLLAGLVVFRHFRRKKQADQLPRLHGLPVIGMALKWQKDPLHILQKGFSKFGSSFSRSFGIKLGSQTHYVITNKRDLEMMKQDNTYEVKFSLSEFFKTISMPIITKQENFDSDLHNKLVRMHLSDPATVSAFGAVMEEASREFLRRRPLASGSRPSRHASLNDWSLDYIVFVVSRCIVGPQGYDDSDLLKTFLAFNDHATKAMTIASFLPGPLKLLAPLKIQRDFKTASKILLPIIAERKKKYPYVNSKTTNGGSPSPVFLDFIIEAVDDDKRVSDLATLIAWAGITNLQTPFAATLLDIINNTEDPQQSSLVASLDSAAAASLDTFQLPTTSPRWTALRAAVLESVHLSGPVTGPARLVVGREDDNHNFHHHKKGVHLASYPSMRSPKGAVAALSPYATHRDTSQWGSDAAAYKPERWLTHANGSNENGSSSSNNSSSGGGKWAQHEIGDPAFIAWGLADPHLFPGRWFAQTAICVIVKAALEAYRFELPEGPVDEADKYVYTATGAWRRPVPVDVHVR
ncbi:Alpha-dioxygenase 1 [Apiospora phragmitis]|uniref:Alpha-dioxygenase 1 n=1 Tax=Apiospora phragmitis TaxID=2905665 RepID=A0ABR1VU36_9PEZI